MSIFEAMTSGFDDFGFGGGSHDDSPEARKERYKRPWKRKLDRVDPARRHLIEAELEDLADDFVCHTDRGTKFFMGLYLGFSFVMAHAILFIGCVLAGWLAWKMPGSEF